MGLVAVLLLFLSMIRAKFAAILIGVFGVGLLSGLTVVQGVAGAFIGFGIQSSAIRALGIALATNDFIEIRMIKKSLKYFCWLFGLVGMCLVALFSTSISNLTFNSAIYEVDIAGLGLVILLANVQAGNVALIQGLREIKLLAIMQILSGVAGTFATLVMYFWLGLRGIVPALVLMTLVQVLLSEWILWHMQIGNVKTNWNQLVLKFIEMARLGFPIMWSGILTGGMLYLSNYLIVQNIGLEAVGIYSAAFALSGIFVNFILSAMAADYYPRLAGLAHDKAEMRNLVNHQTEVGLLLAAPGLLLTITLAPLLINIFYSDEFLPAVNLLQWFVLGCFGRIISWPLGFIMLALNNAKLYFLIETGLQIVSIVLIYFGLKLFGLAGVAIAFFVQYIIYTVIVFYFAQHLIKFRWTAPSKNLLVNISALIIIAFITSKILPNSIGVIIGLIISVLGISVSILGLIDRLDRFNPVVLLVLRIPGINLIRLIKLPKYF